MDCGGRCNALLTELKLARNALTEVQLIYGVIWKYESVALEEEGNEHMIEVDKV